MIDRTTLRPELLVIVFGAVLFNTVPIWVGELARAHGLSDTVSGLHASLLLLAAAGTCAGLIPFVKERSSAALSFLALMLLSAGTIMPVFAATTACGALGLALGALSRSALNCVSQEPQRVRMLSAALTIGLVSLRLPCRAVASGWPVSGFDGSRGHPVCTAME